MGAWGGGGRTSPVEMEEYIIVANPVVVPPAPRPLSLLPL